MALAADSALRFEEFAGTQLACREDGGSDRCGFFWLGGFRSDMTGTKAEAIAALARETGRPCLRFDYSGHGQSGGAFEDGTISAWGAQALHMFNRCKGKRIVIGSSMGGWLALLLAKNPEAAARIAGLVLMAPAADFTHDLMWSTFPEAVRSEIRDKGVWLRPSAYGEPYPITARLIEDGKRNLLLREGVDVSCPARIIQGDADIDVPVAHAMKVYEALRGPDIHFTLIKGGDHRLSSPAQLKVLRETVLSLAEGS